MSEQNNLRYRKQRFPRRKFNPSLNQSNPLEGLETDEDSSNLYKRPRYSSTVPVRTKLYRPVKSDPRDNFTPTNNSTNNNNNNMFACRLDKRARDEHNEQERSRRRELAVIYELIRCSFSEDDLRYLDNCNGPKSIEKLSYPQVLQIAYQLSCEEQHNLILFEKCLNNLKIIEKEYARAGLPVPERPSHPSILENYRKVIQIVDNLLRIDKSARSVDGVYEMAPSERAALGDEELSFLRSRSDRHTHHDRQMYSDFSRDYRISSNLNNCLFYDTYQERDDMRSSNSSWYSNSSTSTKSQMRKRSSATSLEYNDEYDVLSSGQSCTYQLCINESTKFDDDDDYIRSRIVGSSGCYGFDEDDTKVIFDDSYLVSD